MALVYIAVAWIAGIVLASLFSLPAAVWLLLLLLPLGYLTISWSDLRLRQVHTLFIILLLGALRFQLAFPDPAEYALAPFNDQGRGTLIGTIVDEPDTRDTRTNLLVEVTSIRLGNQSQPTSGRALVQAPRDTPVRYGDEVQVDGELRTPPSSGDFSYRDFLARQSIFTIVQYARVHVLAHDRGNQFWTHLFGIKQASLSAVNALLPEPSASLLSGILLGRDQGIPASVSNAFKQTNTSHIIAISGFNIALLALYLGRVFRRAFAFNPRLADWFTILALVIYTLLVGANASVVRAAIMGTLVVIAAHYGRQPFILASIAASALLMTCLNPFALWDLGFQLSFFATLGLVLYSEPLTTRVGRQLVRLTTRERARHILSFLSDSFIITIAATVMTFPLIAGVFHRLSLVGLMTNLLILPSQPPIMILGGIAVLLQLLSGLLAPLPVGMAIIGGLAQVIAWGAYVFLQYTILVVQWSARLPLASIELPYLDAGIVVVFYVIIFAFTLVPLRKLRELAFSRPAWTMALLALTVILVSTLAVAWPDRRTHLQFIATSGGSGVLIRTANGSRILIDGTAEPSALLTSISSQMPFWDRRLDLIVATSLDEQNLASLNTIVGRFDIGQALEPPPIKASGTSYRKWRTLLEEKGISSTQAQSGLEVQLDEVALNVVYPSSQDGTSNAALRIAAAGHTFFFAPALHKQDVEALTKSDADLSADTAILPLEFSQELLARISPGRVILFVGRSSKEQPSQVSLGFLEGIELLRTDQRGSIEFVVDGGDTTIATER